MAKRPVSIAGQEASYRRGMVLGLTMAEILALALFVLMLLLMALQYEHETAVTERDQQISDLTKQNTAMSEIISGFESVANGKQVTDFFKELVEAKEAAKQVEPLKEELGKVQDEKDALFEQLREITTVMDETGIETSNLDELKKDLELRDELVAALENQGHPLDPEKLDQTLGQYEKLVEATTSTDGLSIVDIQGALESEERKNKDLEGRLKHSLDKLASAGKGTDNPPCWTTPEGKIQYIYDVAATVDGMKIRIHDVPEREEDRKRLPTEEIVLRTEVSYEKFREMTARLRNWADENKCSWWAVVYDQTPSTAKALWKKREHQIGERFYRHIWRGQDEGTW